MFINNSSHCASFLKVSPSFFPAQSLSASGNGRSAHVATASISSSRKASEDARSLLFRDESPSFY